MLMADTTHAVYKDKFFKDLDERGHEICVAIYIIVVMEWGQ